MVEVKCYRWMTDWSGFRPEAAEFASVSSPGRWHLRCCTAEKRHRSSLLNFIGGFIRLLNAATQETSEISTSGIAVNETAVKRRWNGDEMAMKWQWNDNEMATNESQNVPRIANSFRWAWSAHKCGFWTTPWLRIRTLVPPIKKTFQRRRIHLKTIHMNKWNVEQHQQ